MSEIIAVDPGPTHSALVGLLNGRPLTKVYLPNEEAMEYLQHHDAPRITLAVEMIACYGMAVGKETFETCIWIGRFIQEWRGHWRLIERPEIKLHLCGSARAKDGNVRQALLDKFGGDTKAKGTKKAPGPLYGFANHTWAALAVGVYAYEVPEVTK